ncbi:unnamed protein product [Cuscuta campestris]|uniref:Chromo domain-containing protein n=1 Tax=Cuscuta campestris TaxID=132261 RepID=A0A484LEP5_9ASTE|nr:unnamed protein product [Cuscuta campestris]
MRNFHLQCMDPPLKFFPLGTWYCNFCVKKKVVLGVHSVSQGVEAVFYSRDIDCDKEVTHKQKRKQEYWVKYKGLAHIHNRWIPETDLIHEAPKILARFKKFRKVSWKTDWTIPHRLLGKRLLVLQGASETSSVGNNDDGSDCHYEWLVKWRGLDYDQATWELETASCLNSPLALQMISDYESSHKKAILEGSKSPFPELLAAPFECTAQVHASNFVYVNKLIQYWQTNDNAVAIDNEEQILKMVLLVSSFASHTRHPFFIITTNASLSDWEDEFSRYAPSINVVVYKGNGDVRAFIRTLEFYNEQGAIMFQVLISHYDTVVQDIEILKSISWEAIIIDIRQRSLALTPLRSLSHINVLAANKKLLLFRQIEDRRSDYRKFLSLLDPENEETNLDFLESGYETEVIKLKERFAKFVAYECKSSMPKFVEYWVPVRLSDLQIEQYCACLLSNSHLLCSSSKNDSLSNLHEILMTTRKCCDHPYLVDWTLGKSIVEGLPVDDHLDLEIELSGKLQLLSRILFEVRKRRLRVLILFQSLPTSGGISVGDILDDFIHQKFGKDIHARICVNISPPVRRSILNKFNKKESGEFVLLMEARACVPSIKLSAIDTVVLFDSDWDPVNDFRALQKITIDSKFEQLTVFRLYSSCTIEEKILILAKSGLTVDGRIQRLKQRTCHELLAWGASYLFSKRDDCHPRKNITQLFKVLFDDVFSELLNLLPGSNDNIDSASCSRILRVEQVAGAYTQNISLPIELETQLMEDSSVLAGLLDDGQMSLFWTNLFEGRHQPMGRCLSDSSFRARNQPRSLNVLHEDSERGNESDTHREAVEGAVGTEKISTMSNPNNEHNQPPVFSAQQSTGNFRPPTLGSSNAQEALGSHSVLQIEMNKIQMEREQAMKMYEELKLLLKSEFEEELLEVTKKYDLLLENVGLDIAQKQEEFDARYARVYANSLLAEFMIKKVNSDYTADFLELTEKVSRSALMQDEMHQMSFRQILHDQLGTTAAAVATSVTRENGPQFLPVTLQEGHGSNASSAARQTMPFSCVSFSGNLEAWSEIRAPPPHLRRLTPKVLLC